MTASKLVPLSGVVAVVLFVVALVLSGETPDNDDPVSEVVSFYVDNDTDQLVAGIVLGYAALFFLFFATSLRNALRRGESGAAGASTLSFGGAILFVAGVAIFAGLSFALGDAAEHMDPSAVQALHVLNNDMFFPLAVGMFGFALGSGIAIVRTAALPGWLGWAAIVLSVFSLTPLFFIAFLVLGVWTLIVSVLLSLGPSPSSP